MGLRAYSKSLRDVADAIDRLFEERPTLKKARQIRMSLASPAPRAAAGSTSPKRTPHWTQRPENRAKVRRMARKARRTRTANGKAS